jgi:hypothetical protein
VWHIRAGSATADLHPAGASTLYVHDNLSDPPLSELLADHIATGAVQYIWWNHTFESGGRPTSIGVTLHLLS